MHLVFDSGAITHIVHLMKREDLELYAAEMFGDVMSSQVTPLLVVHQFFELKRTELTQIIRRHFHLGTDFNVEFYDRTNKQKRAVANRSRLLDNMWSHNGLQMEVIKEVESEERLMIALRAFFEGDNGVLATEDERLKLMMLLEAVGFSGDQIESYLSAAEVTAGGTTIGDLKSEDEDGTVTQMTALNSSTKSPTFSTRL